MAIIEGCFYAVMVGTAETFALFFAVKRNVDIERFAWLSTLPILVGSCAQWLVPGRIPARYLRRGIASCLAAQVVALAGLAWSFTGGFSFAGTLASLTLYWTAGLICSPLWLDWVSPWLPQGPFASYLANRNRVLAVMTLLSYVSAAFYIHTSGDVNAPVCVFGVAILARLISTTLFLRSPLSPAADASSARVPTRERFKGAQPVLVMAAFTIPFKFSTNLSSPFFLPYMLHELKLELPHYVLLTAAPFIGRALSLSGWGLAARTLRPFLGIQIAMLLIAINPILWTLTNRVEQLAGVELVSGMMWGGLDLCTLLVIQNFWKGNARAMQGLYLAVSNAAALAGACVGARLRTSGWSFHDLFFLSSDVRFVVAVGFITTFFWLKESSRSLKVYGEFLSTVLSLRISVANVGRILFPEKKG